MQRLTRLLILGCFALTWLGCGTPPAPEPIAETASALNGHSVPPPGGWGTEPWLCSPSSWNPMTATWPAHGYCVWQPDPNAAIYPWNVGPCLGAAPTVPGSIWIYSQPNFAGQCAQLANAFNTTPYQFDSDFIQVNGWFSIWHSNLVKHAQFIQSMRLAPATTMLLCEGPFTGPPGAPCNQYRYEGGGAQAQGVNVPTMIYSDGSPFYTAAIQLAAWYP